MGDRLKQIREKRGVTQEELAEEFGVSRMTVYRWEKEGLPEARVEQVADALDVTVDELTSPAVEEGARVEPYVRSADAVSDWRDAVMEADDLDFDTRSLLNSLPAYMDRTFWVYIGSLEWLSEQTGAPLELVEEKWPAVLESEFVDVLDPEGVTDGDRAKGVEFRWVLALKFRNQ